MAHALSRLSNDGGESGRGRRQAEYGWFPRICDDCLKTGDKDNPRRARIPPGLLLCENCGKTMSVANCLKTRGDKMLIGYLRVSKASDDEARNAGTQRGVLEAAGCEEIFEDIGISGGASNRPGWTACQRHARQGDTIIVTHLDRLSRDVVDGLGAIEELAQRGVWVRVLDLGIGTDESGPTGRLTLTIMLAIAQWFRETTAERIREGLARALAEGRKGGRPPALTDRQAADVRRRLEDGESVNSIAKLYGLKSRNPVSRLRDLMQGDGCKRRS